MTPKGQYRPGRLSWQVRRRPGLPIRPERANHQKSQTRTSSSEHATSISSRPAQGRPPAQQRGRSLRPGAVPEAPELDFGVWLEGLGWFRPRGQGRPLICGQERLNLPDLGCRHRRPGRGVLGPRFQDLHYPGAPLHRHPAEPAPRGVGRAAPGQVQVPHGCQQFPGLRRSRLCTSR